MGRGCWLIHLLLMCFLGTTRTAVNAQILKISRETPPEGHPVVEGNEVKLQCKIVGLRAGYFIEWTRFVFVDGQVVIARNELSLDSRYTLAATSTVGSIKSELIKFTAIKEDSAATYGCRLSSSSGMIITAAIEKNSLSFTVVDFPSAICIPNGPQEGTTVNISCTTEVRNPSGTMQILTSSVFYVWEYDKEQVTSLQLSVTAVEGGGSYQCQINPDSTGTTLFTGMNRSCTIGPITGGQMTTPQQPMSSVEPTSIDSRRTMTVQPSRKPTTDQANFDMSYCQLCQTYPTTTNTSNVVGTPWLVAFLTSLILFIVSLIINIFLMKNRHLKITKEKETNVAKADPYMDLQPTEDKNEVYMEPTTATATTQDTYYQPVDVETDSPEDGYLRPDDPKEQRRNHPTPNSGATGTQHTYYQPGNLETDSPEYDFARPDDHKEQRKNHQVRVHVDQTPSSGTTGVKHTYYQPGKVDKESPEFNYARPAEGSTDTSYELIASNFPTIMSRGCWLINLLLMCSLETTHKAVNAQIVTITRVSPVGDPVEGDVVKLRCQANWLIEGYNIEWTRMEAQEVSIARNGISLDSRYRLSTLTSRAQDKVETLTFDATREDTSVIYGCRGRDSLELSSSVMVQSQPLPFSMLYFPSAMYPICNHDGPFTVQEGTIVNMSCTTEIGNPPVQMQILTSSVGYVWTFRKDSKDQMRSLQLSATAADDGGSYQCKIVPDSAGMTPFTGMERSCTIGPITVSKMATSQHPMSSAEPTSIDSNRTMTVEPSLKPTTDQSNFDMSYCQPCQTTPPTTNESNVVVTPWIVAFITSLFIVSLIIGIFFLIKHRHLKITKEKETNVAKADPYMELQPTEDKNKIYMEPTTATTTTQDTYYEPVDVETDSQEDGYLRPDDPKEQRRNHPTPSSGATGTQHTYYQPGNVETDSPEYDYARPDDPKEQRKNHQVRVHVDSTPSSEATGTQHTYYQPGETDSPVYDYARPDDPKEQTKNHQVRVHVDSTPSSEATGTQHTYYQPGETDSPVYDYVRPDDHKEQRKNYQVSVHVDPTPNSEATGTQHTYYQPVKVETDSPEYDYARPTEGSTDTSYEVPRKPQSSAKRQYQNIKF
ncbi:uncharacterized protein [Asterias amurensis]|uniref:uncharacterized protein n=1 Tax=Asterias amurensis TaxID=7602 RepID=UPI003AB2BA39